MSKFNIQFDENFDKSTNNCFIQLESGFKTRNLGENMQEAKCNFVQIAELAQNGQIFVVIPSNTGISVIYSENYAFCIQFDSSDSNMLYSRFIESLTELGAMASTIEANDGIYLIAINKQILDKIIKISCNMFFENRGIHPNKIFLRITSNNVGNIISDILPNNDDAHFYFQLDYTPPKTSIEPIESTECEVLSSVDNKMKDLRKQLEKMNPNIKISFERTDNQPQTSVDLTEMLDLDKNIADSSTGLGESGDGYGNDYIEEITGCPKSVYSEWSKQDIINAVNKISDSNNKKSKSILRYTLAYMCIWGVSVVNDIPQVSKYWSPKNSCNPDYDSDILFITKESGLPINMGYIDILNTP